MLTAPLKATGQGASHDKQQKVAVNLLSQCVNILIFVNLTLYSGLYTDPSVSFPYSDLLKQLSLRLVSQS